jgi:two-component system chemotaxis response regulator CheB
MIRVVLADDSAVVRDIVRAILESDPEIEVAGTARNGREAVELAKTLRPDVLLMDVRMPIMDGIEATSAIMAEAAVPILVLSAGVLEDTNVAFRAVQAGAIDVVQKPRGTLSGDYRTLEADLVRRVKLVARVPPIRRGRRRPVPADPAAVAADRLVVLGASTGGPPALASVLGAFSADFPAPLLAVQHISPGFLAGFVEWLDSVVPPRVVVAEHGVAPRSGTVHFAPEEHHLELAADGRLVLTRSEPRDGHRPSATVLFESAARVLGRRAVGVLLTGMGRDGAEGLRVLREAGARTICQDEATSVVFGMPAAAIELGAAEIVAPVERIGHEIARALAS